MIYRFRSAFAGVNDKSNSYQTKNMQIFSCRCTNHLNTTNRNEKTRLFLLPLANTTNEGQSARFIYARQYLACDTIFSDSSCSLLCSNLRIFFLAISLVFHSLSNAKFIHPTFAIHFCCNHPFVGRPCDRPCSLFDFFDSLATFVQPVLIH